MNTMNLNNTLCKVFEKDKNGDVTIETALETIGGWICFVAYIILAICGLYLYLYGLWYAYTNKLFTACPSSDLHIILCELTSFISIMVTVIGIGLLMLTAFIYFMEWYESIKHKKIANCPVKNNDKDQIE